MEDRAAVVGLPKNSLQSVVVLHEDVDVLMMMMMTMMMMMMGVVVHVGVVGADVIRAVIVGICPPMLMMMSFVMDDDVVCCSR